MRPRLWKAAAVTAGKAETLAGQEAVIDISGGKLGVDGAQVLATDIDALNGVIHVIDRVILPSPTPIVAQAR